MARTRSLTAHQKVLEAALWLVAEGGIEATSMDAIARKSGVSKATIYNHWADKDALMLEMLAAAHGLHNRPLFDSGNTKADLAAVLSYHPQEHSDVRERLMPHFIAYSATNPKFGMAWRSMVMEPPVREIRHLLDLGMQKGELPPALNVELSLSILLGPVIYWKVFLERKAVEPGALVAGVVDAFWKAFATPASCRQSAE